MKCPKCLGAMDGVEYAHDQKYHYDGVSEYHCLTCHIRIGRFCGQELQRDEFETHYCDGKGHPRIVDL